MVAGYVESLLAKLHRPIRIAVSGHRPNQLPEESLPRVKAALTSAFDSIASAGAEIAGKGTRFVLVSALAEGADRLAADAALARDWTLEAPLPFSVDRYEQDFATPESVNEFQRLLKSAAKVAPMPKNDAEPEAGYAAVGAALAHGADLGIVIWNGQAAKGEGGTANVGALVLDQGAPVLWIGVGERQRSKLILPSGHNEKKGARAMYLRGALAARFERIERPAEMQAVTG
jgi:hypothetical protein